MEAIGCDTFVLVWIIDEHVTHLGAFPFFHYDAIRAADFLPNRVALDRQARQMPLHTQARGEPALISQPLPNQHLPLNIDREWESEGVRRREREREE